MIFDISIPVRGQSESLGVALASIAAQKVTLQIAIMDASPDDAVQKVIKQHQLLPLAYMRHGADAGQAAAIEEGWRNLEGDIVHWLNADDYLMPGSLVAVERVFTEHPEIDVVYGDSIFETLDGQFLCYFPEISDDPADLLAGCCISQPACFVRRNAVERVGSVNPKLHFIMDWDLWTRLYLAGARFFYLNRPLAAVRIYPDTKTEAGGVSRLREIHRQLWKYAGLKTWARSMAAFIVDSGSVKKTFWRKSANTVIDSYRSLKRAYYRKTNFRSETELYGIERRTNVVNVEAIVWRSWYDDRRPRELRIVSGQFPDLRASINGVPARPKALYTSKKSEQMIFRISDEIAGNKLLRVRMRSSDTKPWVLLSALIS